MSNAYEQFSGARFGTDNHDVTAYRYRLWRVVGTTGGLTMLFVMLNPSTAGALVNDPTIRRCIRFAQRERCSRMEVVNLFAYRATNPKHLTRPADPVGPSNDSEIAAAARDADLIVCAWGAIPKRFHERRTEVLRVLDESGKPLHCLGVTADGEPRHPLMLAASTELGPYVKRQAVRP